MSGQTRRRTLRLVAGATAAAVAAPLLAGQADGREPDLHRWEGRALGADASILIGHPSEAEARRLINACVAEIDRMENLFSLQRPGSAIARLNAAGGLADPPAELVELLGEAAAISARTEGAFDVTVQPLWELYADHFSHPEASAEGPDRRRLESVLERVGYRRLQVSDGAIRFARPAMAITLNGIAQGYVTDRVADLLRRAGLRHVLIDLGEHRAIGTHPSGREWQIGIADPRAPWEAVETLTVADAAVATSSGLAASFDDAGRFHHLFDPHTGLSASDYATVTVSAPRAALADALSTALAVTPPERAAELLERFENASALLRLPGGETRRL